MAKKQTGRSKADGTAHLVSIGTSFSAPREGDLVDTLIADIKSMKPERLGVLATADSHDNAERLIKGVGINRRRTEIIELESAQSLNEAYTATSAYINRLEELGYDAGHLVVHYTAGTKVMASGMVLAAASSGCQSLRYLYSRGPGAGSEPVITTAKAVRAEGDLRMARMLMRELRFRAASEILQRFDPELLTKDDANLYRALTDLAPGYAAWDNFRVRTFLRHYRAARTKGRAAGEFELSQEAIGALDKVARVEQSVGVYPVELIFDLYNNAIRRLMERRTDDALTRLYRAAELFAQNVLLAHHKIRTDDVDIRKVPPRDRVVFEALRRMDDVKIKLGLRKSYELLAILDNPVGNAFIKNQRLSEVLQERRHLVLAHGTKPAPTKVALDMIDQMKGLLKLEIKDFDDRAALQQFPWIDNESVLARLRTTRNEQEPVPSDVEEAGRRRARRAGGRRGSARGRKSPKRG
ncbi:TIGR02710 family CRISPR-associated protein [bacterium]|nr:TIGR02710 family CRISPR-associated protein [bacterium]